MSIPEPLGTCGLVDCLAITAHTACETFPELLQGPTPEPDPENKSQWRSWKKGYDQWGKVKCGCGNGYFCRQHGIWVPGADVLEGHVVPRDQQDPDSCPAFHYEETQEDGGGKKRSKKKSQKSSDHKARGHAEKHQRSHRDKDGGTKGKGKATDRRRKESRVKSSPEHDQKRLRESAIYGSSAPHRGSRINDPRPSEQGQQAEIPLYPQHGDSHEAGSSRYAYNSDFESSSHFGDNGPYDVVTGESDAEFSEGVYSDSGGVEHYRGR